MTYKPDLKRRNIIAAGTGAGAFVLTDAVTGPAIKVIQRDISESKCIDSAFDNTVSAFPKLDGDTIYNIINTYLGHSGDLTGETRNRLKENSEIAGAAGTAGLVTHLAAKRMLSAEKMISRRSVLKNAGAFAAGATAATLTGIGADKAVESGAFIPSEKNVNPEALKLTIEDFSSVKPEIISTIVTHYLGQMKAGIAQDQDGTMRSPTVGNAGGLAIAGTAGLLTTIAAEEAVDSFQSKVENSTVNPSSTIDR